MITTVIFDLDDTLYDEVEYCRSGFAAVAEFLAASHNRLTAKNCFDTLWEQFSAGNRTKTFNAALNNLNLPPSINNDDFIAKLITVYRSHIPTLSLPQESRDILFLLRQKYILGLLTDGFLPTQQLKVNALNLEQYFQSIIYTEQLGRQFWKPSTVGFEKIMKTLNAAPENTVYIADNETKDFIGPNKLGIKTIQILRPRRIHTGSSTEPNAAARHIISDLSQLPNLLKRL